MNLRVLPCVCAIVVLSLACIALVSFNGGSLDFSDREVVLVVSDSMNGDVDEYEIDSFPANTLVMVEHLSEYEKRFLRVGDVISYSDKGVYVQHRVVIVNFDSVYVHGDNNHSTEIVSYDDIIGKVVGTSSWMGSIIVLIQGNFLLFLAAAFVICASLLVFGMYSPVPKREVD